MIRRRFGRQQPSAGVGCGWHPAAGSTYWFIFGRSVASRRRSGRRFEGDDVASLPSLSLDEDDGVVGGRKKFPVGEHTKSHLNIYVSFRSTLITIFKVERLRWWAISWQTA
jgi:hypothetical protein